MANQVAAAHVLQKPWYVLLASDNNSIFLVYGMILLTSFSWSLGVAMKDTTAAVACAIHQPGRSCVGVGEAVTSMVIISLLALVVAYVIIRFMCTFLMDNCSII